MEADHIRKRYLVINEKLLSKIFMFHFLHIFQEKIFHLNLNYFDCAALFLKRKRVYLCQFAGVFHNDFLLDHTLLCSKFSLVYKHWFFIVVPIILINLKKTHTNIYKILLHIFCKKKQTNS